MAEQNKKLRLAGREVDVVDVPIKSATEAFVDYELEDGSKLRVKSVLTSALRLEGQNNLADGNPIYIVQTMPVVSVVSAPENLIKKLE
jgi:hypothetical protein